MPSRTPPRVLGTLLSCVAFHIYRRGILFWSRVSGFLAHAACVCELASDGCIFLWTTERREIAPAVKGAHLLTAMPDYAWICHSCRKCNTAGTETCRACGFSSVASSADIGEAGTNSARPPRQNWKAFSKARRTELAALPLWKKPLAYLLLGLQLAGGVTVWAGIFNLSLLLIGLGLVIAAGGGLLLELLKGRPYAWETSMRTGN